MDRFAIYLASEKGPSFRVTCVARDGAVHADSGGFEITVHMQRHPNAKDGWGEVDGGHHLIAAELLALALVLGQPATLAPVGDQPDMPVWVVLEGAVPTVLLANLYRRLMDTSSDQRPLAARA